MGHFFHASQIFIVHNGSRPENISRIKQELEQLPSSQHLVISKNAGYSGGANAGLRWLMARANFPWLFFITNDCEIHQWNFQESQFPTNAIIAPLIKFRSMRKIDSYGGQVFWQTGVLKHLKEIPNQPRSERFDHTYPNSYIPGSAFLVHRGVVEKFGPFDERLHTFWEDVDWSKRLNDLGVEHHRTQDIMILHGGGKTTHHLSDYTFYYYQRNRLAIVLKNLAFFAKIIFMLRWWRDVFVLLRKKRKSEFVFYLKEMAGAFRFAIKFQLLK